MTEIRFSATYLIISLLHCSTIGCILHVAIYLECQIGTSFITNYTYKTRHMLIWLIYSVVKLVRNHHLVETLYGVHALCNLHQPAVSPAQALIQTVDLHFREG